MMRKFLRRALRQNPNLDIPQWKRGWYAVGRRFKK